MKKSILIAIMTVFVLSCGGKNNKQSNADSNPPVANIVNVYYFHGKQRCKTCIAVEEVTQKTIESNYKDNNRVKFIEVNTGNKENKALVEKYEITWNALIIASDTEYIDITNQGFANAVNNPDVLSSLIVTEVDKRLNN